MVHPFGEVPGPVTHWMIERVVSGKNTRLRFNDDATGVALQEWPVAELSVKSIRRRWGAGTYRLRWFARDEKTGGRKPFGASQVFTIEELARKSAGRPEAEAAGRPSGLSSGFDDFMKMHSLVQAQATAQVERERSFVREVIGLRASDGAGQAQIVGALQQLAEELRKQSAATQQLIERVEALETGDDEDGEGEDDDASGPFVPGAPMTEQVKAQFLNTIVQNMPQILSALPELAKQFGPLASASAVPVTPPPAATVP